MGSPCRNFSGGSIHEVRVRYFSARQSNVGAVEVRPLPILAGLVADDVGEPPARSNLEAYGATVPKLLLTMSGFTFDSEEVHKRSNLGLIPKYHSQSAAKLLSTKILLGERLWGWTL